MLRMNAFGTSGLQQQENTGSLPVFDDEPNVSGEMPDADKINSIEDFMNEMGGLYNDE